MAAATVFDRILSGEIPCYRVYEDDQVLAFLDVGPLSPGHTLVIPKERAAYLHQLSEESAAAHRPRAAAHLPRRRRRHRRRDLQRAAEQRRGRAPGGLPRALPRHPQARRRAGAGVRWPASKLDPAEAERLRSRIVDALER